VDWRAYDEKEEVKRVHKVRPNKMREVFIFVAQLYKAFSIVASTTAATTLRKVLLHDTTIHAHVTGMTRYDLNELRLLLSKSRSDLRNVSLRKY
jgi:hypothetical protein